jgi:hypothetical protein
LEEQVENNPINNPDENNPAENSSVEKNSATPPENKKCLAEKGSNLLLLFPVLLCVLYLVGFTQLKTDYTSKTNSYLDYEDSIRQSKEPKVNFAAMFSADEFSKNLRDTVYTDKDKWIELRIDEQKLYVHFQKSGRVKTYPISTGNKFLNKGIESRPGLFAIFYKEELHLSSQFDDAKMFYYMPFNMGIGFHGLAGTGYYGNLGVRPSSHGCIRMRTEDAKELFRETEIGTLVLVHRGASARVIAFAPEGFHNDAEYSKEDYNSLFAYNLNSIYEGKYFINPPKRFIADARYIPKYGINIGSNENIPEKQIIPQAVNKYYFKSDLLDSRYAEYKRSGGVRETIDEKFAADFEIPADNSAEKKTDANLSQLGVNDEMIKKLVYNPIGILPYFPPNK